MNEPTRAAPFAIRFKDAPEELILPVLRWLAARDQDGLVWTVDDLETTGPVQLEPGGEILATQLHELKDGQVIELGLTARHVWQLSVRDGAILTLLGSPARRRALTTRPTIRATNAGREGVALAAPDRPPSPIV